MLRLTKRKFEALQFQLYSPNLSATVQLKRSWVFNGMDLASVREVLARTQASGSEAGGSSFTRNVASLLERVEYRRCESGEDLEAIYRLRYRAYRANQFVPESPDRITTDIFDDTPNCYRFGVFIENELVSTVRIHHVSQAEPFAPIISSFEDVLVPRLERGESFINPTLLAADPQAAVIYRALPYVTLRLAVIANSYFDTTSCICVVRAEHAAFYRRVFGAVQVGEPRSYPPFTVTVMLYDANCAINMPRTLERFPFFKSKPVEQRLLFGRTQGQDDSPLTILPTAKYLQQAA